MAVGDEVAIRMVARRPRGTEPLDLPPPHELERVSDPKRLLRDVLIRAGVPRGDRRRKKFVSHFGKFRRQLAENLPVGGPLEHVAAWVKFATTSPRQWRQTDDTRQFPRLRRFPVR